MKNKKRLIIVILAVVLLLALAPKKLSWLVPGSNADITGYVMHELFSGDKSFDPTAAGVEDLRAVLDDTWVLWWGFSNTIPMENKEDNPLQLELYTDQLVPVASFCLSSDRLLYADNPLCFLCFRPLNTALWKALERLERQ